ncbi:G-protein coupled receptor 55 isoform X2 [Scleropages formosus]|uniref:G protein-coupled receptor 55 n=1 Tax=Scleropages formosus TaxID=113540 RepID=A0A8C9RVX8_SCLFO|nr:G-protein coupled receptor 55-like isoform X2 [Scleropages formosus]
MVLDNHSTSVIMTNCSFDTVDNLMRSLELVIYIPIFVFGLLLNILALVVFYVVLKKRTETTIYMTNLALMDLLLLFSLPFKMHATNHKWAPNKKELCSFLESLYFISMYGSIYTIMFISIDRYVAIRHPIKARSMRSPKTAIIVCVLIWLFVLGATSPVYRLHDITENEFHCFHGFSKDGWNPVLIACLEVFGFLVPALVLVSCSIQIILRLRQSQEISPKRQDCIRIIYSNLLAFLLPFTPSHLAIFLQFLVHQGIITACSQKTEISLFLQIALSLSNVTCCLDALCYYFMTREIRSSKDILSRSISFRRNTSISEG